MTNKSERILITGANGFVGRHLIDHLHELNPDSLAIFAGVHPYEMPVTVSDCAFGSAGWNGGASELIQTVALDICDAALTEDVIREHSPRFIYHLAARSSGADRDRESVFAVNVTGTENLLRAARKYSPSARVLLISTGYVYGETDPTHPAEENFSLAKPGLFGAYTDSKIEMEKLGQSYNKNVIIARAFSHTGPGQSPTFAIPSFARQIAQIEIDNLSTALRVGNLNARRDMLEVRDVARAYKLIADFGKPGNIYNVASGSPVSIGDIIEILRSMSACPISLLPDMSRMRPGDISCSTGCSEKLRLLSGWKPQRPLNTTLRELLDYWREKSRITD